MLEISFASLTVGASWFRFI